MVQNTLHNEKLTLIRVQLKHKFHTEFVYLTMSISKERPETFIEYFTTAAWDLLPATVYTSYFSAFITVQLIR